MKSFKKLHGDLRSKAGSRRSGLLCAFLLCLTCTQAWAREDEAVAATTAFEFYSRPMLNLHDHLMRVSASADEDAGRLPETCKSSLDGESAGNWVKAIDHYKQNLIGRRHRRRQLAIRFHLGGLGEKVSQSLGAMPQGADQALKRAEAAYRACFWERQDGENRRWIENLLPSLKRLEPDITKRLAQLYGVDWHDFRLPVDIVQHVSRQGASTVRPTHILIGSSHEKNQGQAALEIVFHEASHSLFGPRSGPVTEALRKVADKRKLSLPRDLWHVVLFLTTGHAIKEILKKEGVEYTPYVYSQGLFSGSWSSMRKALEAHWTPYLEGRASLDQAAAALVAGLPRGDGRQ